MTHMMKSFYKKSAIVDNNILIDLDELSRIYILFKVFNKIGIPQIIIDTELDENILLKLNEYEFQTCVIDSEEGYKIYSRLIKHKRLSECDKVAIAIAKQFNCYCNSNDALVRKVCNEEDVKYVGILGVIGCAFEKEIIDKSEFMRLIGLLLSDKTSCYIKKSVIEQFLEGYNIKTHISL